MMNTLIQTISPVDYSGILNALESSNMVLQPEILAELKRALADHKAVFKAAEQQIRKQLKEAGGLFSAFENCKPLFNIHPDEPIDSENNAEDSTDEQGVAEHSGTHTGASESKKASNRSKSVKPSKTIEHKLSADQKTCPCCGKNMHQAHEKVVTIIRLTGYSKERHVLETRRCLNCDTKVEATAPQEKTICSFTIPAAALLVSLRYAYGLPQG